MCCPRRFARLRPSAVRVRIRSRSTSAKPPSTASISRPVLVPVSAHGSASERNCALASVMRLTMANRSKVLRASQPVDARHHHHVAGGEGVEQFEKLAVVAVRPRHLLAVNLGTARAAQLRKLGVEGLPVGTDAGIADASVFRVSSGHILREA